MYERYRLFIERRVDEHRGAAGQDRIDAALTAWALVGMGTVTSIARDLGLLATEDRQLLWQRVGPLLLEGRGD